MMRCGQALQPTGSICRFTLQKIHLQSAWVKPRAIDPLRGLLPHSRRGFFYARYFNFGEGRGRVLKPCFCFRGRCRLSAIGQKNRRPFWPRADSR